MVVPIETNVLSLSYQKCLCEVILSMITVLFDNCLLVPSSIPVKYTPVCLNVMFT